MVLVKKNCLIIFLLLFINVTYVFGQNYILTGLVQYGKDIDREQLELLENKQIIHLIGGLRYEMEGTYTIRNSGNERQVTLGILLSLIQGFPHPEDINLEFLVNNNSVNYIKIENYWSVSYDQEIIDTPQTSTCWALIDVIFLKNSIVTINVRYVNSISWTWENISLSYNLSQWFYFPELLYWRGQTKFSIERKARLKQKRETKKMQ